MGREETRGPGTASPGARIPATLPAAGRAADREAGRGTEPETAATILDRAPGGAAREDEAGPVWALVRLIEEEGHALVEHLDELRMRLIFSLAAFVLASVYGWTLAPGVFAFFHDQVGRLIFVAPAEAFFTRLKIAFTIGLLIASPVIVHQAWRFVLPALFPHEKRVFRGILWSGAALFAAGAAFGFFAVYPISLRFFMSFGTSGLNPAIVISRHLGFFLGTTLSFGIAFQLPLVLLALARLGAVTSERLREWRKPALFFAFVIAGALTPADAVSQLLMAIPLTLLYELAVRLSPRFERPPSKRPPELG